MKKNLKKIKKTKKTKTQKKQKKRQKRKRQNITCNNIYLVFAGILLDLLYCIYN